MQKGGELSAPVRAASSGNRRSLSPDESRAAGRQRVIPAAWSTQGPRGAGGLRCRTPGVAIKVVYERDGD